MKIKQSLLYHLNDGKKSLIVYYIVITSVLVLSFLLSAITKLVYGETTVSVSGLDTATMIFLFVFGLNFFKSNFRMLIQNGVSRKTLFIGAVLSMLCISLGLALIDRVVSIIGKLISFIFNGGIRLSPVQILMMASFENVSSVGLFFLEFIYAIFANFMTLALGYVITLIYYRLPKMWKVILSICVPAFVFIVFPIFDAVFFNLAITNMMFVLSEFILQSPLLIYGVNFLIAIICLGCSYLLLRKAVIKANNS